MNYRINLPDFPKITVQANTLNDAHSIAEETRNETYLMLYCDNCGKKTERIRKVDGLLYCGDCEEKAIQSHIKRRTINE